MTGVLEAALALLLAVAGVAKLRSPGAAVTMLVTAWPAVRRRRALLTWAVRAGGAAEVTVAAAVLGVGGRVPAALLGLAYLAFAGVVVVLLRRGTATSCGCFGAVDSPAGPAHLVVNLLATAIAALAVVVAPGPLAGLTDASVVVAVTGLAQAALLAGLAYLSVTALPALLVARRRVDTRLTTEAREAR